ncbi:MAG: acyl-CoA dehydrogenase family protein [Planctomycetes bacterium]|nr:acyl-CoA dehydrogenase family protein [Planctomycetota bacterium]
MDFTFTEEQQMLREMVRDFVNQEVKPRAAQIDREEKIPNELLRQAAELGLFGVSFPEEYGGAGAGKIGYCIAVEELAHGCNSLTTTIGASQSIGAMAIYLDGSEEQKQRYLVPLAKGEKLGAFCLSESNAGSDPAAMSTTAVKQGDHYVLNGSKNFITNGVRADVLIVFAITDKALRAHGGTTAFILEREYPGIRVGKVEDKMGLRGSDTASLFFEDVRVPASNVLGQLGKGFVTAMKCLDMGRLTLGAGCLGMAKEMLDLSVAYAKERVQFGEPIATKQAVQFMLAEMAMRIYAMESLVYRTAWAHENGQKISRESAIVKCFCTEAAEKVVDLALQIHGGMGYMKELPIERAYRDARINRIFEGTNEIQRLVIALDVIKKGRY